MISDSSDKEEEDVIPPKKKKVSFSKQQRVRTYLLETDDIESKLSESKLKSINVSEYEMKRTPKKVKNFASIFRKKVGICTKMLTKPQVESITSEQKESAQRTLKKLIDMRARVRKLNKGNDEPLTEAEYINSTIFC